ncbi:gluconokinase [Virgibacillus sp. L01]|uniref:gluconokinase n=1 Tax=Virgibacillus sp. L01 TaxID=3457429 RepID=UPI003FD21406
MSSYIIGLDIGTTSAKALMFDYSGRIIAEHEKKYPILYPELNFAEQNPLEIEMATIHVLKTVLKESNITIKQLKGIGISSAMHSLICTTDDGEPLSNSIIWADSRGQSQADQLKRTNPDLFFKTGTPLHSMTPLAKLIWMKELDWQPYKDAKKYVSIKEFIVKRWFNEEVVDYSIAASTGLFDVDKLDWNMEALTEAGITKDNLFSPVPPTYLLKGLKSSIAEEIGLDQQIPFTIGASDGPLANLGVGALEPGDTAITIGTSCAIRQFTAKPLLDKKEEIFTYRFDSKSWITGGASNNGGIVLAWLQSVFSTDGNELSMEDMSQLAASSPPGANNLLFLPYITGERAPVWDSQAKGTFIGLTSTHKKGDLIRAAMEGVILNVYQIGQALDRLGNQHINLFANGGFSHSDIWVSILADIFGKPVHLPESHQSSAWGAAWLALFSLNEVTSLSDIKKVVPMKDTIEPNLNNHLLYKRLYEIFKDVYGQINTTYTSLDNLRRT